MSYRAQPAPEYHRSAVSSPGRRGEIVTFLVLVVAATIAVAATFPRSSIAPLASAFVPVAVLIVLTPIQGRSVWTGLGLTRVGVRLWPVAVAVPIAVAATSYLVISRLGMGNPIALSDLSGFSILINVSVATVLVLGEELGWRGYLLPRVQQLTTRPAGAILTAVAHAAAHLPLILLTSTYNSVGSRSVVAPLTVVTISGAGSLLRLAARRRLEHLARGTRARGGEHSGGLRVSRCPSLRGDLPRPPRRRRRAGHGPSHHGRRGRCPHPRPPQRVAQRGTPRSAMTTPNLPNKTSQQEEPEMTTQSPRHTSDGQAVGDDHSTSPTRPGRRIKPTFIRRHPVACFFVLAYVLTWGGIPWNSFFTPGALIAALVVIGLTQGRRGLRQLGARIIRWRVSWIWYAIAIAVPLAVHAASISINVAIGAAAPSLGVLNPWYGLPLALALHTISPFGGPLMEEPSFRGFAQPELQKTRSRLAATAIMAVLVTGWHMPLFFMPVFEAHPIGIVTTLSVTFWYAWLLNHASGSVLITLIAHGTEGAVETNSLWGPGADLERLNFVYAAVWCLVAVGLVVSNRTFWTRTAPADPPARSRAASVEASIHVGPSPAGRP